MAGPRKEGRGNEMEILEGLLGLVAAVVTAWFKLVGTATAALVCLLTGDTKTAKDALDSLDK